MECSEVRLKLDEYLSHRLDPLLNDAVAAHIEKCEDCQEELNVLMEINELLTMETPVFADPDFTFNVMKKVQNEKLRERRFFLRLPSLDLGASFVLAGLLTIFISIPPISGTINKYVSNLTYNAQVISTSINSTTQSLNSHIKNILNAGGK